MAGLLYPSEKSSAFCGEDGGQYLGSVPEWVMCGPLLQLLQTVEIRPLVFGVELQGGLRPVIGTCEQEIEATLSNLFCRVLRTGLLRALCPRGTSLEEGTRQLLSYLQKGPNDGTLVPPQPF